jgi:hypothetical protein
MEKSPLSQADSPLAGQDSPPSVDPLVSKQRGTTPYPKPNESTSHTFHYYKTYFNIIIALQGLPSHRVCTLVKIPCKYTKFFHNSGLMGGAKLGTVLRVLQA